MHTIPHTIYKPQKQLSTDQHFMHPNTLIEPHRSPFGLCQVK